MFKQAKLYSLLLIIVTSTAISLFTYPQAAIAQDASAPWDDARVLEDARAVTLAHLMNYCLDGTSTRTNSGDSTFRRADDLAPTQDMILSGDWFQRFNNEDDETNGFNYNGYAVTVGYGINEAGDDGKMSCNDESGFNVSKAFTTLAKLTEVKLAACTLSFRLDGEGGDDRPSDSDCATFDSANSGKQYFSQSRGERGDSDPMSGSLLAKLPPNKTGGSGYNEAQYYLLYKLAFTGPCEATLIGPAEAGSGRDTITLVNKAGEPISYDYDMPDDKRDDTVPVAYEESKTCGELAEDISGFAGFYGTWMGQNQSGAVPVGDLNGGGDSEDPSNCKVDGIGWLVCPASRFIAGMVDNVFSLLQHFLRTEPISTDTESGTYKAWSVFRSYANIIFVILFLIIIYAQMVGGGLSNYSIKKMLPRIIMGAILVNTSYWICAVGVDLSNLLGEALQNFFKGITDQMIGESAEIPTWDIVTTGILAASLVAIKGVAISAGAGGFYLGLMGLLLPMLAIALLSIMAAFIVLAARQALIVILIVMAPLAFAAYLLPNTQKWFDRWKDLFTTLLILYPLMSILFGGSQLAARIIMNNATNMPMVLLALGVQVIPLALTPLIVKLSGSLLGRFAGMVNNPNKGPVDSVRKWSEEKTALGRKEALGDENPNRFRRILQNRDNSRRKRETRGRTAESSADTRFSEYASTDREMLDMAARTKSLEERKQTADDTTSTHATNALSDAVIKGSKEAELKKATADDRLVGRLETLVASTSIVRIDAEEAKIDRQASEDRIASGVTRGITTATLAQAEQARLQKQTSDDNAKGRGLSRLAMTPGGQAALGESRNAELRKEAGENVASTVATSRASHALEGQATQTGIDKKAAEDNAKAAGLLSVASTTSGRNSLKEGKDAQLREQRAENVTKSIGSESADRSLESQANKAAQRLKTSDSAADARGAGESVNNPQISGLVERQQANQAAVNVAQGVLGRRFSTDMATGGGANVRAALGVASPEIDQAIDTATAEAAQKETQRAIQPLRQELARATPEQRDDILRLRARDPAANEFQREAALQEAAQRGRDGVLRDLRDTSTAPMTFINPYTGISTTSTAATFNTSINQASVEQAIGGNSGSLVGKAPDLVKGLGAAFNVVSGDDLVGFSNNTMAEYMGYIESELAAGRNAAAKSLRSAVADIAASTDRQGNFKDDKGRTFRNMVGVSTVLSADPDISAALGSVQADGKIR